MQTASALVRQILSAANDDPLALLLPAFVILIGITIAARILKGWTSGRIAKLFRAGFQGPWLFVSLAVGAFVATAYLGQLATESRVDLEADMQVSAGQFVEVRANDPNLPPLRAAVVRNERRVYRFEGIPASLTYLRIDPTESPAAGISIYSLSIVSRGRVLRWFGPGDLRSWRMVNMTASGNQVGFTALSTTDDPILDTTLSFVASTYPSWVEYTLGAFRQPHFYTLSVMMWFLAFLAAGMGTARGTTDAALVAAVAVMAYPVACLVRKLPMPPPPVTGAIGNATYTGYPKLQDYLISFVLVLMCLGIAWAAARFIRIAAVRHTHEGPVLGNPRWAWAARLPGVAVCLALAVLYIPSLGGVLDQLRGMSFRPVDFDSQNSLLWAYLVAHGYLPFRDFWYPYAGFFAHMLPFPAGAIIIAAQQILTLWFLYLALRYIFPRFRSAAVALFVLMLVPVLEYEFVGWFRYLLGVDLALFYVALQATPKVDRRRQAWFACLAAFVLWYEPAQLIYAGAGIVAHLIFAAWPKPESWANWKSVAAQVGSVLRRRIAAFAAPALIGILPVLLFLAAMGMLPGFVRFHLTLSDQSAYGALPADVAGWALPVLRFDAVFLLLFFTLALALHGWLRDRSQSGTATVALLVICLSGVMAMQKQLVRPHNMQVVQVYPCLAALLYSIGAWPRRTRAQAGVVAVFLGFIAGIAQYQGTASQLYRSAMTTPGRLAGDLDVFWSHHNEFRRVDAGEYEIGRFAAFGPENEVMGVLKSQFGWTPGQRLYVLGDDSVFYILAGQEPPYVSNNYNCSPLVEQQHVLQWLQARQPRFVVWNPVKDAFDGVPHVVRLPLIYQYVVENYHPVKTVGPYQILAARQGSAATDALYWRGELGTNLDLGHIPELTPASVYGECPAGGAVGCAAILYVRFQGKVPTGKAIATIDSIAGPLQVRFDLVPGTKEYIIDLDRLWFRSFLPPHARVDVPVPGAEVKQERRLRKSGMLY